MYKSTFMGLNTALRGVLAQQTALETTGHNIANINTPGYTRQRAELTASDAWSSPSAFTQTTPGQIGTGVVVNVIERLRDQYIDQNARNQLGNQANQQAMLEQLGQVEAAFQEPGDNGLSATFKKFFDSAAAVAAHPESDASRGAFASAAQELAQTINQIASDLNNVRAQSDARLNDTAVQVNSIASRIAALNDEIRRAIDFGHQPNDLLDTRDVLMDDLSKLVNYTSSEGVDGQVTISFGSFGNLVDPTVAGGSVAVGRIDLDNAFMSGELLSGRAYADQQLFNNTIPGVLGQLDLMVNELVTDINAANSAGFDGTGAPGGNIFDPAGVTAGAMMLDGANNILANPARIAAASSWNGPGEPTNGTNFLNLVNTVRTATQPALGTRSFESFYQSVVSNIGSLGEAANRNVANADVLVDMALGRRDQVSGVSLEEEMSNMLRFQHAYNASSRVMSTMDELLDVLINRTGRVGL